MGTTSGPANDAGGSPRGMSAIGTKRTSMIYGRMSAIEGKADIYVKVMPIRAMAISYGALHATTASGRVRLAIDGGAKIAR
jgi:hypothetical protein